LNNTDFLPDIYHRQQTAGALFQRLGAVFELQKKMTFASFDWKRVNLPLEQRQNLEAAYNLALDFAKSPEGWLVFAGVNGSGKRI